MTDTTSSSSTPDAAAEALSEHALGELEHIDPTSLQIGLSARRPRRESSRRSECRERVRDTRGGTMAEVWVCVEIFDAAVTSG